MAKTHFGQRCKERGIASIEGDFLGKAIQYAIETESEKVEFVMGLSSGNKIFRFQIAEGRFYAIVSPFGRPITLYTQEMMRSLKYGRKARKRFCNRSKREGAS